MLVDRVIMTPMRITPRLKQESIEDMGIIIMVTMQLQKQVHLYL